MSGTGGARHPRAAARWGGGASGRPVASAVALGAVLLLPCIASPQAPARGPGTERGLEPSRLNIGLFVGALSPLNDLTSDPASFGTSVAVSPTFGADASFWLESGRFGIGLQGLFAPGELQVEATEFQGAVPDELGDADTILGTATLLYRLQLSGARGRLEPYFGLGAGLRRLAVDPIAEPEVVDATDPVAALVAGTHVWLSRRLAIRFDLRDHLSSFESPTTGDSRLQNDILVTVGAATRIR